MSNINGLSAVERNIVIVVARNGKDFGVVARIAGIDSPQDAQSLFETARNKLVHSAYGEPDNGWLTASGLASTLKVDHYWVVKNNRRFENLAVLRDAGNGMVVPHYPPQVLEALRTIRQENYGQPDEGWVTITTMRTQLGTDWNWMNRRLGPYRHLAVRRRSNGGHSLFFYPPQVLNAMRTLRQAQKACPEAGDYLNVTQLREELRKSWTWIAKTLEAIGFVAELRRDRMQKVVKHYPPHALSLLREVASEFPPSGDWLTINRLAKVLKVDREWVESRIHEHGFIGEVRCQPGYGKPMVHYPPNVRTTLRPLVGKYPAAGNWLTANALDVLTGTSLNWVMGRLLEMNPEAQMRKDEKGVPRLHYPPEVLEKMQKRKQLLDMLQATNTSGLAFRLRILSTLSTAAEPITLPGIKSKLKEVNGERKIYDNLLWLNKRGLVERIRTPGKRKTRWLITEKGRRGLALAEQAEVSA